MFRRSHQDNNRNKTSKKGPQKPEDKAKFYLDSIANFCDKCGTAYTTNDVKVIQDNGFNAIIHFSCSKCKATNVASFLKPVGMSSRMPINSDLDTSELKKFAELEAIDSDDVIEADTVLFEEDSPTL